jgi:hypothetical protein
MAYRALLASTAANANACPALKGEGTRSNPIIVAESPILVSGDDRDELPPLAFRRDLPKAASPPRKRKASEATAAAATSTWCPQFRQYNKMGYLVAIDGVATSKKARRDRLYSGSSADSDSSVELDIPFYDSSDEEADQQPDEQQPCRITGGRIVLPQGKWLYDEHTKISAYHLEESDLLAKYDKDEKKALDLARNRNRPDRFKVDDVVEVLYPEIDGGTKFKGTIIDMEGPGRNPDSIEIQWEEEGSITTINRNLFNLVTVINPV